MTTVVAAPSVSKRLARVRITWWATYAAFAVIVAAGSLARMLWAWPDAVWQTNLSDIDAIDRLLSVGPEPDLFGITVGGEHALTGYRWFLYANARLFGLNTHVELYAYFLLTLTLSLLLGRRLLRQLDEVSARTPARLLIFSLPLLLSGLAGAGSRGMELGQYSGVTLLVILMLLVRSRLSLRAYAVLVLVTVPAAGLLVLGGYLGGPAIALAAVCLVEWRRRTLDGIGVRKLWILTAAVAVMLAVWLVLMTAIGPSEVNQRLPDLLKSLGADPLFVPKYFLGGAAGAVMTVQTLEVAGHGARFAYAVGAVVTIAAACGAYLALRRPRTDLTVPLFLLLTPVCLAATFIVGRATGALWLLSPWYGFELHLFAVGIVWLVSVGSSSARAGSAGRAEAWLRPVSLGLVVVVAATSVFASTMQYRRQPAERAYFQRIQDALLHPERLTAGENGLTPLVIPLEASRRAIEVLRKHHLNVYRNPDAVAASLGESGTYASSVELIGMLDGAWAGDHVVVVINDPTCQTLTLDVTPFPALNRVPATASSTSEVAVDTTFGGDTVVDLAEESIHLHLHPHGQTPTVLLRFDRTWVPRDLGLGADERALSAQVVASCAAS